MENLDDQTKARFGVSYRKHNIFHYPFVFDTRFNKMKTAATPIDFKQALFSARSRPGGRLWKSAKEYGTTDALHAQAWFCGEDLSN